MASNVFSVIKLILLFLGAVICYAIAGAKSLFVFVIFGVLLEIAFWCGLFKKSPSKQHKH